MDFVSIQQEFLNALHNLLPNKFIVPYPEEVSYRATEREHSGLHNYGYFAVLTPLVSLKKTDGIHTYGSAKIIINNNSVIVVDGYINDIIPLLNSLI